MADSRDMQEEAAPHRLGDPRLVMAGLFGVALIPMLVTPVMPLIDFYNHLTRYFVLAHIGADPVLQTYYQAHWTLLPDIGVDLLATPLLRFFRRCWPARSSRWPFGGFFTAACCTSTAC